MLVERMSVQIELGNIMLLLHRISDVCSACIEGVFHNKSSVPLIRDMLVVLS